MTAIQVVATTVNLYIVARCFLTGRPLGHRCPNLRYEGDALFARRPKHQRYIRNLIRIRKWYYRMSALLQTHAPGDANRRHDATRIRPKLTEIAHEIAPWIDRPIKKPTELQICIPREIEGTCSADRTWMPTMKSNTSI